MGVAGLGFPCLGPLGGSGCEVQGLGVCDSGVRGSQAYITSGQLSSSSAPDLRSTGMTQRLPKAQSR